MIGGSQSFFNLQETLLRDSKNGQRIGEAGGIISAIVQINSSSITASPKIRFTVIVYPSARLFLAIFNNCFYICFLHKQPLPQLTIILVFS